MVAFTATLSDGGLGGGGKRERERESEMERGREREACCTLTNRVGFKAQLL